MRERDEKEKISAFLIILGFLMNRIAEFTQTIYDAQTKYATHQNDILLQLRHAECQQDSCS
jgi:hypothetical protein